MSTNFDGGVSADGVPLTNGGIQRGQGNRWYVKPSTGSNENNGKSLNFAFSTVNQGYTASAADQNDIVYMAAEGNSVNASSSRVSATFDWAKDLTHLIGINNGINVSQRSRIAFASTYVTASNLFTMSADACYVEGMQFYAGVADANPTGAVKVTGDRNHFVNCHIAGIGADEMDIAGAYSLKLDTAGENKFSNCTIGITTVGAGTAANQDLLVDGASARNEFVGCKFTRRVENATNFTFFELADATAIEDYLLFENCKFLPTATNYTPTLAAIGTVPALTQGFVYIVNCVAGTSNNGAAIKWDSNDSDKVQIFNAPTPAADTAGMTRAV